MSAKQGVGIEYSESSLNFIKASFSNDSFTLQQAIQFPLPGMVDENLSENTALRLKQFLKTKEVKISQAVVGITGENMNHRYLKVPPASNAWRMSKIAEISCQEMAEQTSSRLAFDYMPLNVFDPKSQEQVVLLSLAKNSFLNRLDIFFQQAGIKVQYYVPKPVALYHCFLKFSSLSQNEGTLYLVDVGRSDVFLSIIQNNELCFIRNLNIGKVTKEERDDNETISVEPGGLELVHFDLEDENDDNATVDGISAHLEKKQSYFQKIPDFLEASTKFAQVQLGFKTLKTEKVLLTGSDSLDGKLIQIIASRLECSTETLPIKKFSSGKNISFLQGKPEIYKVALGLASLQAQPESTAIRLVSQQKLARSLLFGKHFFEYAVVVILGLFLAFSTIYSFSGLYYYENQLSQLNKKYAQYENRSQSIKAIISENQEKQKRYEVLQKKIYPNKCLLELLSLLHKQVPPAMLLENVKFVSDKDFRILVKGVIEESEQDPYIVLKDFQEILREDSLIKKYEEKDPQLNPEDGRLSFEFALYFASSSELQKE